MIVLKSYLRIYTNDIDRSLSYYETLLGEKCSHRFNYSEMRFASTVNLLG
jgi:predicted enzyme related to lactoylglutathione lyase